MPDTQQLCHNTSQQAAAQVARKWSDSGGKSDDAPAELDFSHPASASDGDHASANGSAVDLTAKSRIDVSEDESEDESEGEAWRQPAA